MAKRVTTGGRTLERLRRDGWDAGSVERFFGGFSHDLFNCIDIIAMNDDETLGVQCTTTQNQAARITKILQEPLMERWVRGGRRLQVWGWAKRGPRGKRKLWDVTVTEITADMF